MRRIFIAPVLVSLLALAAIFFWGGIKALIFATALAVLEMTLSFDNAVVNAKILARMPAYWQRRFLTWGMLISVAGVRLVLPILIISAIALVSPLTIAAIALGDPTRYAVLIAYSGPAIKAFGGAFLLLVALNYFFDTTKDIHWFGRVERRLAKWGEIRAIEIALVLGLLLMLSFVSPDGAFTVLKSGLIGIILFIIARSLGAAFGVQSQFTRTGVELFIYANILDATLSLDGVIGAFAITRALPIIVVGLGIGAYFVRTLTIAMVHGRTLERFIYLEHGAHWAIFGLALCMLVGLVVPVPEWLTATIGLFFIALAYASSRREEIGLMVEN